MTKKNILVLAPHTDDGELGMGGTIARMVAEGNRVVYAAFSTAEQSVPEGFPKDILNVEVAQATHHLGVASDDLHIFHYEVRKFSYYRQEILEDLIRLRSLCAFDMVFCPSLHDVHQDHATLAQEAVRAFKGTTLLGYELAWNNLQFDTQCLVRLEKRFIEAKCKALGEYHSQGRRNYMSEEFIYSLARTRGVQAGCEFAEAFEVIRLFM
ncbi:MAG: PIG-L family deacetylase [Bacteroidales bacterium]|nr:PIG-L family deacetylase [Bacteroidales bacterium]